ncbi:MAG: PhoH family protein [Spirosomataceae bacterium]
MTEKRFLLEDVPLLDFVGVQNRHIKLIADAFPQLVMVARGDEIVVKGTEEEVESVEVIIQQIIAHLLKYTHITEEQVRQYVQNDVEGAMSKAVNDADIILHGNKGQVIKAKTANQRKMLEAAQTHDIVFAIGPAGTGKTYTAVALAVQALKNRQVKKIIITRPAVEAGENLGFLPGDLKEKIDPYLRPIYDALEDMIHSEKLKGYIEKNTIEIAPLAYMRGRTLNNAFILLDEAQNTTPMQLKMFLTRMGPTSKIIITGDKTQIDLPKKQKSGLVDAEEKLYKVAGIKFIELDGRDVVRHPLVREILKAYEQHED